MNHIASYPSCPVKWETAARVAGSTVFAVAFFASVFFGSVAIAHGHFLPSIACFGTSGLLVLGAAMYFVKAKTPPITESTGDASKVPEGEGEKPKTQVARELEIETSGDESFETEERSEEQQVETPKSEELETETDESSLDPVEKIRNLTPSARKALLEQYNLNEPNATVFAPPGKHTQRMCALLRDAIKEGKQQDYSEIFLKEIINLGSSRFQITQQTGLKDIGVTSSKNDKYRSLMEDVAFAQDIVLTNHQKKAQLVVMCDGHGDKGQLGNELAIELPRFLSEKLHILDAQTITDTLTEFMVDFDKRKANEAGGTTVTGALILENTIYVFNVGDSRTILCKPNVGGYQLTQDTKPSYPRFQTECNAAGNYVARGRVNFTLATARDLGLKYVSAQPDISFLPREDKEDDIDQATLYAPQGSYLVCASDGLWDVATTEQIYQSVTAMDAQGISVEQMSYNLVHAAMQAESKDNIAVIVIKV